MSHVVQRSVAVSDASTFVSDSTLILRCLGTPSLLRRDNALRKSAGTTPPKPIRFSRARRDRAALRTAKSLGGPPEKA